MEIKEKSLRIWGLRGIERPKGRAAVGEGWRGIAGLQRAANERNKCQEIGPITRSKWGREELNSARVNK